MTNTLVHKIPNIEVSFGTTKYCKHFLKHEKCTNDTCYFYHSPKPYEDIINLDEYTSEKLVRAEKNIAMLCLKMNIHELVRVEELNMKAREKTQNSLKTLNENQRGILNLEYWPILSDCPAYLNPLI